MFKILFKKGLEENYNKLYLSPSTYISEENRLNDFITSSIGRNFHQEAEAQEFQTTRKLKLALIRLNWQKTFLRGTNEERKPQKCFVKLIARFYEKWHI
ncbi:hypothetical protein AVEN_85103-1 [Araneus ventricosus]|uniref:Uncharacterized protein n=1 Tax=Araneus ventricosus TaxID=182803 RepID=A0A4Y2RBP1_ARAVE|nr:hypothetical protein AVEN_85103-1 [Araneus ventricosus]